MGSGAFADYPGGRDGQIAPCSLPRAVQGRLKWCCRQVLRRVLGIEQRVSSLVRIRMKKVAVMLSATGRKWEGNVPVRHQVGRCESPPARHCSISTVKPNGETVHVQICLSTCDRIETAIRREELGRLGEEVLKRVGQVVRDVDGFTARTWR
jgi:hypothetical protein